MRKSSNHIEIAVQTANDEAEERVNATVINKATGKDKTVNKKINNKKQALK